MNYRKYNKYKHMGKVIAIANHKGGVAKTTTALNFGAGLVLEGKKVLLVDVDPQCNLTETLLQEPSEKTVYTSMLSGEAMQPLKIKEGLYLIPSDKNLNAADMQLATREGAQVLLRGIMESYRKDFDYILIDTPPSRAIVTVNALSAADEVIIPTLAEILSVRGVKDIQELMELVRERINPSLTLRGFLLVMFGDRTGAAKKTAVYIEGIASILKTRVFRTRIRKNVTVVESQMAGTDIFEENPLANAARDYRDFAREYLGLPPFDYSAAVK